MVGRAQGGWLSVALRKESVDRNSIASASFRACAVALRKESVDRNKAFPGFLVGCIVALRKESVDRNGKINTRRSIKMSRSPQGERG